ncbi:nitrite reductase [Sulfolobus acidocaldarius]|uniref:Sulfite reductase n=4 Tax=Sulfolobus acidocaldarius TaxID=2285 RepID=Q4J6U2_SULAC|nr:sulfite reductase [Sulfolobus acidocaldarius DSM 639]AGE72091.1 sulfite reductase [Sulfolobus acidocaldarius N8]AGE74409.1 sulfite reductase [Sulfolobus acidocaldarius Ron12/I]ALU29729.1 nitrite reductase [Sulfolobus acidocaldarius]ALU32463.1 nitrite reductase [Sulfolobus acidocaldarius]
MTREDLENEVSLIAKSFGIYVEFHREKARVSQVKDWIYMIRVSIPGGGPISSRQWRMFDDIANKYTISDAYTGFNQPSIKLTTRQDIQFHHVKKRDLVNAIREIAETGYFTLNGCGDNVRNTVGCPISSYYGIFNSNGLASKIARYFRLPSNLYIQVFELSEEASSTLREENPEGHYEYADNLLPRKFKIGIAGVMKIGEDYYVDDCIEARSNDIGIVPLVSRNGKIEKYQLYVGGGMGENNGYPTFSALALPLGTVSEDDLLKVLDSIVRIQQDWGDRKNRHWARLKYVVHKFGIIWMREKIKEYSGVELGPVVKVNLIRDLHLGWQKFGDKWVFGIFVENGRLIDNQNGRIKSMARYIADKFENLKFFITPNQHLIISEISDEDKHEIENILREFGYGLRNGKHYSRLRTISSACVGFPTCKMSFTDSERFLPKLIDELEGRGWGNSDVSIGVSGCVAQCSRPALHPIGWVGSGYELYMLKIGGDKERVGEPLIDYNENVIYLYQVPASRLADVNEALFQLYEMNKDLGKTPGEVFRKLGNNKIIEWLKSHEKVKDLMKPHKFDKKVEGYTEYHRLLSMRLEEVDKFSES